ncbi:hypothetical protein [Nocardia pseudobrasiliensis]|uniref:hypothetical protein n=1 Tax=Nocardia pseudobrasiliensis TaxID=45979 RepID=UPI0011C02A30|nr:hypothetical protein [Nocardia pseudobrasiliensis]
MRSPAHSDVLRTVDRYLESATPNDIRRSYLDLSGNGGPAQVSSAPEATIETTRQALRQLDRAATGFVRNPNVRGRRLRFERFTLLAWLMQQTVEDTDRDPDRTLRLKLQQRGLTDRIGSWIQKTDEGINYDKWWWRTLMACLRLLTVVTFNVAVTGRVPLLSGRYRWFLRQRYLAPELASPVGLSIGAFAKDRK